MAVDKTTVNTKIKMDNVDPNQASGLVYPYIGGHSSAHSDEDYSIPFHPEVGTDNFYHSVIGQDGSVKVRENNKGDKPTSRIIEPGHKHESVAGGESNLTHGNKDPYSGGNINQNAVKDTSIKSGGDHSQGSGGVQQIGSGGDGSFHHDAGGNKYVTTSGDHITQHDGHIHTNIKGDAVDAVVGNKYTITQKDYGIHVQGGGNMDFKIDGGKFQVNSGSDLIIKSSSKIILQVGGSSITITPNDITINSGGTVNIKGSGDIITKGQTTKLQGGGPAVDTEGGPSSEVFAKV